MKTLIAAIILLLATTPSTAQDNTSALLPIPKKVEQRSSKKLFDITRAAITTNDCSDKPYIAEELKEILEYRTGIRIDGNKGKNRIEIAVSPSMASQEYSIEISDKLMKL
ncbi:MAG: hypothetical protein IKU76_03775, partial [Bacteroidaceae bacterium]|nr:hypothetical protein [Bacteroidaceae bacterium]